MTEVFSTISPVFASVLLGWQARKRGFMPPDFLGPANRLVYYLSITVMRENLRTILTAVLIKLIILPGAGLLLYRFFQLSAADCVPGLILLAAPTATVTYVMSKEMQGDADFAVAAISASTLFSAVTYLFWLMVGVRYLY